MHYRSLHYRQRVGFGHRTKSIDGQRFDPLTITTGPGSPCGGTSLEYVTVQRQTYPLRLLCTGVSGAWARWSPVVPEVGMG